MPHRPPAEREVLSEDQVTFYEQNGYVVLERWLPESVVADWLIETGNTYSTRPRYVGRPEAAAPATGIASRHRNEQQALVDEALTLDGVNTRTAPSKSKKAAAKKTAKKKVSTSRRS